MKKILLPTLGILPKIGKEFVSNLKFTLLAIFVLCLHLSLSAKAYSQKEIKKELNFKRIKFKEALIKIESVSEFKFFYNSDKIPTESWVSLQAPAHTAIGAILTKLLDPLDVTFEELSGNVIALSTRDNLIGNNKLAPITGIVKDEKGETIPGVTIKVKGSTIGTLTNSNGEFKINAPEYSTLVFSYLGFENLEVKVNQEVELNIILKESSNALKEVVVVGYGKQAKALTTSSISTLNGNDIVRSPVGNINNSIAGRVSGVLTFQSSGEPGADASSIRVRGVGTNGSSNDALTIVDGIQRPFSQLNPEEIETITILKDAAAIAPYGLAGANGVVLVTTKRGKAGKVSLNFDTWYGVQQPTRFPDYLNSYDYASTLNIASANAGLPAPYSDEVLQKYKDHSDPDHYPDHDWLREVIDFAAPMTSQHLTFTGGSEKVRFFSSLGNLYQQGSVDAINYSRYNFATNVDVNATNSTIISFDIKGSLEVTKNPGSTTGTQIYTSVTKNAPLLNTPLKFSNGLPGNSLLPSINESGYNRNNTNILFTQLSIKQDLKFIQGLSLKGVAAYDKNYRKNKQWQIPYSFYSLNAADEFIATTAGVASTRLTQGFNENVNITLQAYLDYKRTFGKHDVSALVVAEQRNGDSTSFSASRINYQVPLDEISQGSSNKNDFGNEGTSSKSKQLGFVYRLSYAFNQKYLAEFSGRYDGHYFFAPGKRFAFFPAASFGWRLSEESFIKDNISWINNLKLRTSFGKSGNLAGSPFQYLNSYGLNSSYVFGGSNPTQVSGIFERSEPNINITWETAKKLDIGFEASLFNRTLNIEADWFKERRSDMLVAPTALLPVEYGIGVSQVNGGVMDNQGFDFSVNTNHTFENKLTLNAGVNFSYAKNKLVQIYENGSTFDNVNRRITGRPLGTQYGYQSTGYFQTQEEIDAAPKQNFSALKPGDIRYADLNNDGVINEDDQTVIGNPAFPQIIYGLTFNASFKGFDLGMLWQGAAQSSFQLTNEASNPFFNGAKIFREQLDYWTPENRNAAYPIILPSPSSNSQVVSSFWQRDGKYLRLKNIELGYNLPKLLMQKLSIGGIRIYASGQNLLTFTGEKYLDPEIGASGASKRARYYFQQKVFSFGINANF
ncbi:SusC/RagA family TonB-linked outer membrane protein [Arcticibacter svalbardensis]|nr:TonB-dependent receptor [Arcticibacter svalbardensis]